MKHYGGLALLMVGLGVAPLTACGGGGDPGPGPLKHHFDEYHIARIPIEERQSVFKAQNDYHVAKGEKVKAQADLDDNAMKRDVAKNELQQTILAEKSAQAKLNSAEKSGDMTRVNNSKAEMRAAEMTTRASDQKIVALRAKTQWLKKHLRYTLEQLYAQEARYELAKAQIAQSKNIRPRGFAFKTYQSQSSERSRRAQRYKSLAENEKQEFNRQKKEYFKQKKAAARAAGGGASR